MEVRYALDPERTKTLATAELRKNFLIENLFEAGKVVLVYSHVDRAIVGSAVPAGGALKLEAGKELAAEYFAQRREIGVINIGKAGKVIVDGETFALATCDFLYIGRGSREIAFKSDKASAPAKFYFVSYPAHAAYPTRKMTLDDAVVAHLGSDAESNKRSIYKVIRPGGIETCQLVMGMTTLAEGSIWNTMAAHTHERRSEVYLYFNLPKDAVVFHFMGEPTETRHIVIREGQAVLSPSWSIHAGAGTRNYSFVWSMGGENQEFSDMDGVGMDRIQ